MCTAHASNIDDPKAVKTYSTKLLRQWKSAQIEEHRQRREGWPLTNAMADQAIKASFSNVAVVISNSNVQLGGEGGKAPGAGGGGGGAIGPGARGGKGGKGGRVTDLEGKQLPEDKVSELKTETDMEPPPGSGGSGAGSLGPGAVGGDGGDGGDAMMGNLDVEPGDLFEFEVGAGGKSVRLPGQHGESGGETIVTHKSADGKLKRVLRVRGGEGAKSGNLPDDWATISSTDLEGGFQISTLLAANVLEMKNGLVGMLGGNWGKFYAPTIPHETTWPILCVATWIKLEPGHVRGIQLCLSDPNGLEVSRLALSVPSDATKEYSCSWLREIGAPLTQEGLWRLSVISGEYLLSDILIRVELPGSKS